MRDFTEHYRTQVLRAEPKAKLRRTPMVFFVETSDGELLSKHTTSAERAWGDAHKFLIDAGRA